MDIFGTGKAKTIIVGVIGLSALIAIAVLFWRVQAIDKDRDGWRAHTQSFVTATRGASGIQDLSINGALNQIAAFGRSISNLRGGIEICRTNATNRATARDEARAEIDRLQARMVEEQRATAELSASVRSLIGRPREGTCAPDPEIAAALDRLNQVSGQ